MTQMAILFLSDQICKYCFIQVGLLENNITEVWIHYKQKFINIQ